MSLVTSYIQEWERLFPCETSDLSWFEQLASAGIRGDLRNCRFRSVCWRIFLGVLPSKNRTSWLQITNETRLDYEQKRRQVLETSSAQNSQFTQPDNPTGASPWNRTLDDDQELRQTIDQDVVRTHPRVQFFNLPQIQHLMSDILFVFAKLNPHLQYRQGMHELLAPVVFVLRADHQAFEHVRGEEDFISNEAISEVTTLVNESYFEHDAFAMFCCIMRVVEPWYSSAQLMKNNSVVETSPMSEQKSNSQNSSPPVPSRPILDSSNSNSGQARAGAKKQSSVNAAEREILARLQHIHSGLLKDIDPTLFQHLERIDVAPQLYGIRWVRLLFGREFTIQDLLVLWDAIFSYDSELALVDYVFVAMLIYVRDLLLHGDFSACLHVVMRYPPVADVSYLVQSALYLANPGKFPRPPPSQPLPVTLLNNTVVPTNRTSPTMNSPINSMSPSSSFAGDIFDQAGNLLSRGFTSIQRRIEDVANDVSSANVQSDDRGNVGGGGGGGGGGGNNKAASGGGDIPQSSSSSSIRLTRFIPDAIISGAKAPSASAAKLVDKFDKFLSASANDANNSTAANAQSSKPRRPQQGPPKRPEPPKTLPSQSSQQQQQQSASLSGDQTVLLSVCGRALSDLDAALSDLNLLRPVLTDPRQAQIAADIAQRVTAARNSLQVISGRPLIASSSSSSRSAASTPGSVAATP